MTSSVDRISTITSPSTENDANAEGVCVMRFRTITIVGAAAALVITVSPGGAGATTGPLHLQRLAAAQTKLLLGHLKTPVGVQTASPNRCNEGQDEDGTRGTFLLPALAGGSGNLTFNCDVEARAVLVDLGGNFVTEDDRAAGPGEPSVYTAANGDVLAFTKANLERIGDDVLPRFFPTPAEATVDGGPLPGAAPVSTAPFTSRIRPTTGQLYQDSVDLGHPGKLATTYCGWKARVRLTPGHHVITVDLSAVAGSATVFTYNINVED